jgi:hypothetical protein
MFPSFSHPAADVQCCRPLSAALESALADARHQLGCWEQDVMALEFVAMHESFADICDLDMTYNNSHLEVSPAISLCMGRTAAPDSKAQACDVSASSV